MQDLSRKKIQFTIESNKFAIKQKEPKVAWSREPNLRHSIQKRHKREIDELLTILQKQHVELLPFVKNIKSHIKDITESTHICAIYLLLCHIFDNWNSLFLLAENGKSAAMANLLRMIREGNLLVHLFVTEAAAKKRTNLDKWFAGDIIGQAICRKTVSAYPAKHSPHPEIDEEKLGAHIYGIESQASHNAYIATLESVSPFTEDYDFAGYTGFYRALSWLRCMRGALSSTNIALKAVYSSVIKDKDNYKELDDILMKYEPSINDGINTAIIKDFLKP